MVVAPLRSSASASPLGHSPKCSYQSSSSAVDRSYTSARLDVFGPDTGLGVGGVEDLVLEHPIRCGHHGGGIRCDIG